MYGDDASSDSEVVLTHWDVQLIQLRQVGTRRNNVNNAYQAGLRSWEVGNYKAKSPEP